MYAAYVEEELDNPFRTPLIFDDWYEQVYLPGGKQETPLTFKDLEEGHYFIGLPGIDEVNTIDDKYYLFRKQTVGQSNTVNSTGLRCTQVDDMPVIWIDPGKFVTSSNA